MSPNNDAVIREMLDAIASQMIASGRIRTGLETLLRDAIALERSIDAVMAALRRLELPSEGGER